ncbi:hypothetical protein HHI36_012683 [Cryptolaemus montrouzieri]|uniref:FLYWCH-type domain-containing protein n=1 Tax=Cryptolaemus montrouzieri TaxID=559131 RepID=A0ABD2NG49_9CUCU
MDAGRIFVVPGRKHPKIIVDEDEYELHGNYKTKTMWRCTHYHKSRCRANATTFGKMLKKQNEHNHEPTRPGLIHVIPGKKYPKIILNMDEYEKTGSRNHGNLWRCTQYYKTRCSSRLITFKNKVKIRSGHNHDPVNPNINSATPLKVHLSYEDQRKPSLL